MKQEKINYLKSLNARELYTQESIAIDNNDKETIELLIEHIYDEALFEKHVSDLLLNITMRNKEPMLDYLIENKNTKLIDVLNTKKCLDYVCLLLAESNNKTLLNKIAKSFPKGYKETINSPGNRILEMLSVHNSLEEVKYALGLYTEEKNINYADLINSALLGNEDETLNYLISQAKKIDYEQILINVLNKKDALPTLNLLIEHGLDLKKDIKDELLIDVIKTSYANSTYILNHNEYVITPSLLDKIKKEIENSSTKQKENLKQAVHLIEKILLKEKLDDEIVNGKTIKNKIKL